MAWLSRDPDVVYTDLEDGGILLHMRTKLYYSLNAVGQAIWRRVDSVESIQELAQALAAEFEVDTGRAHGSVSRLLRELEQAQLILPPSAMREGPAAPEPARDGSASAPTPSPERRRFVEPELLKHDEPLHDVVMSPFDPQLPLAE